MFCPYSSDSSECQLLLKVPADISIKLKKLIEEENQSDQSKKTVKNNNINLQFSGPENSSNTEDMRIVQLLCGSEGYQGLLVDLPTHIETHKTFDNKLSAFYKSADIHQMIVIQANRNDNPNVNNPNPSSSIALPAINYPSGLLPPTRDIRSKRFERETIVSPLIVSEVESMLRSIRDNTSIHHFQLVEIEEEVEILDEQVEWCG
jgi:TATA-binding protein-associated factor Taf7